MSKISKYNNTTKPVRIKRDVLDIVTAENPQQRIVDALERITLDYYKIRRVFLRQIISTVTKKDFVILVEQYAKLAEKGFSPKGDAKAMEKLLFRSIDDDNLGRLLSLSQAVLIQFEIEIKRYWDNYPDTKTAKEKFYDLLKIEI